MATFGQLLKKNWLLFISIYGHTEIQRQRVHHTYATSDITQKHETIAHPSKYIQKSSMNPWFKRKLFDNILMTSLRQVLISLLSHQIFSS